MIIDNRDGLVYEYVTRNNKWVHPRSEIVESILNKFIAADTERRYKFVVTFNETPLTCDAIVCVYKPIKVLGKLIPMGCGSATNTTLKSIIDNACTGIAGNGFLPNSDYYVLGYYNEDYYG